MAKTQLAVIGAGVIGKTHIGKILHSTDLALVGVSDPGPQGREYAAQLGVRAYEDHRALLDETKPQGVIVATPNAQHVSVALDCLERGIPVIVEKPIADTVAQAQQLVDAQARFKVAVLTGHHRRYNPIMQRARSLVQSGALGQLVSANAMATFLKPDGYFNVAWRKQLGGGPILINLIHDIDMLRFLLGDVAQVQALQSNQQRGFEVEDTAAAVLRFANGALGTLVVSDAAASPFCWDFVAGEQPQYPRQQVPSHFIAGTHGSLTLPDLNLWQYKGERSWHAEFTQTREAVHQQDPYEQQLAHFKAVIEEGAAPICDALEGLKTLQATLAVSEAARTGHTIVI